MDTVDYIGTRGWLIKGIQHLLNWTLIVRLLMLTPYTDSSDQTEPVISSPGDTASFPWTAEIPPFILISWFFEKIHLAEVDESPFSQESLLINPNYKGRFHLHKPGYPGFNLANVDKTDEGYYRLIITLPNSNIQELDWKLKVEDALPASDAYIGIAVAACTVVIAVVVVIVIKRKRNSRTKQKSAGPDEETRPESHTLVGPEDKTRQQEETSPDSHEPIKQVDKTHQPDKQTCEQMNLTQTC